VEIRKSHLLLKIMLPSRSPLSGACL